VEHGPLSALVRTGTPTLCPSKVWDDLSFRVGSAKILGYTQQWTKPDAAPYRKYCMASLFSPTEAKLHGPMVGAIFRVREATETELGEREVVCPASEGARVSVGLPVLPCLYRQPW
jgi:hypothetical protein